MAEIKGGEINMEKFSNRLRVVDWGKIFKNMVIFSAPALVIFFYQLSQGASFKVALGLGLLVIYGVLADFFRKFQETK